MLGVGAANVINIYLWPFKSSHFTGRTKQVDKCWYGYTGVVLEWGDMRALVMAGDS